MNYYNDNDSLSSNDRNAIKITKSRAQNEFVKPENPPKYFGIDLDGTFFTDVKDSLDKSLKALERVKKLGFTPFICTGRKHHLVNQVFDELKIKFEHNGYPGIYCNGSEVYNNDGGIIRLIQFIPNTLKSIYQYLEENNFLTRTIFHELDVAFKTSEYSEEFLNVCKLHMLPVAKLVTVDELLTSGIKYIVIYSNDDLSTIEIPGLKNGKDFIIKQTGVYLFNITPPGGTKAEGLKVLMEHFGEDASSCGYIGDHENDIEIMKLSNLSFAVGNASHRVKREAKYYVNLTNDEAAVAYVLQQGNATPGDRGEDTDGSSIMGMMEDGAKDVLDVTSSGPAADHREAKGK